MDSFDLDKSLDDLYRSLDDSVGNLYKDIDECLNSVFPDMKRDDKRQEEKYITLEKLIRDERLEDRTMSRIGTFERIYNEIYDSNPKGNQSFGYSDLEYSVLINLLSGCMEIELNASVYRKIREVVKKDRSFRKQRRKEIDYSLATQTLGCFPELIMKFRDELKPYIDDAEGFVGPLSRIVHYRNNASHTSATSKNQFHDFYQIFAALFNGCISGLLDLKSSLKASGKSFAASWENDFDEVEMEYLRKISRGGDFCRMYSKETEKYTFSDMNQSENGLSTNDCQYGVIFTDCRKLAVKYFGRNVLNNQKVEKSILSNIRRFITEYACACAEYGVRYSVLDVSIYDPLIDVSHGWRAYLKLLDRYCDQNGIDSGNGAWGLFIIGGSDVIPMPLVNNPSFILPVNTKDSMKEPDMNVDTDLFYSYRSDEIVVDENLNADLNRIFNFMPRFLVGRLPLENDYLQTKFENDIGGYFRRSLDSYKNGGIRVSSLPLVTSCESSRQVAKYTTKDIPLMSVESVLGLVDSNIIISPPYSLSERIDTDNNNGTGICLQAQLAADMLVFILHGSDHPMVRDYLGENKFRNGDDNTIGFTPELFPHCNAKCIAGICCFGARFIGYRREYSALLQAIYNNALLFMGASRSALGNFDSHLDINSSSSPLYASEVFIRYYLACILSGMCAAEALMRAKVLYIDYSHRNIGVESPQSVGVTLLEFNLFGDPLQRLIPVMDDYRVPDVKYEIRSDRFSAGYRNGCIVSSDGLRIMGDAECLTEKRVYSTIFYKEEEKSAEQELKVSEMVDRNFRKIHEEFTHKLYNILGVPPRNLYCIQKFQSSAGRDGYSLLYKNRIGDIEQKTIVELDSEGNVRSVMGTF